MLNPQMTLEQMQAEIARLNAELTAKKAGGSLGLKVSEKGGISMYGLARLPITLYDSQWVKLFDRIDEIKEFIKANDQHPRIIEARAKKAAGIVTTPVKA